MISSQGVHSVSGSQLEVDRRKGNRISRLEGFLLPETRAGALREK